MSARARRRRQPERREHRRDRRRRVARRSPRRRPRRPARARASHSVHAALAAPSSRADEVRRSPRRSRRGSAGVAPSPDAPRLRSGSPSTARRPGRPCRAGSPARSDSQRPERRPRRRAGSARAAPQVVGVAPHDLAANTPFGVVPAGADGRRSRTPASRARPAPAGGSSVEHAGRRRPSKYWRGWCGSARGPEVARSTRSGRPATPVAFSSSHSSVLPLRCVAHTIADPVVTISRSRIIGRQW